MHHWWTMSVSRDALKTYVTYQSCRVSEPHCCAMFSLQEKEMEECTFSPRIRPLPVFLQRMASAYAASVASGARSVYHDAHPPDAPWL